MVLATHKSEASSRYSVYWNNIKEFLNLMTHSYRVLPAVTPELAKEAYKLRSKVFCEELRFEDDRTDGMETDQFDKHATQMVVYSKSDKAYVGCMRIIHGDHSGVRHTLPFEQHCRGKLDHRIITQIKESGDKYGELSRLTIDKQFRHIGREQEKSTKYGKAKSSVILFSLYLGLKAIAHQQGIRYIFAIMEPRLANSIRRLSVPVVQVGDAIEHRGLRIPVLIDMSQTESFVPTIMRPLYKAFYKEMSRFVQENAVQMPNIEPVVFTRASHLGQMSQAV